MPASISALRYLNYIDLYVVFNERLQHYYANPDTMWLYQHSTILSHYNPVGKITAIRHNDYIDIYFVDNQSRLCHGYANPDTNWEYWGEELFHDVDPTIDPIAIRYQDAIDIYCVTNNNKLIHLNIGSYNNWQYQKSQIRFSNSKIGGLSAIRTVQDSIDIYFIENNTLFHGNSKQQNQWKYIFEPISYGQFHFKTQCTRYQEYIDVFTVLKNGTLLQYYANPQTQWKYIHKQTLSQNKILSNFFTAIRFQHHMDLYFVDSNMYIKHIYCGQLSDWQWTLPETVSQLQSINDPTVIRTQIAIDLYNFDKDWKIIHSFIGQGTGFNWSRYESKQLQIIQSYYFPNKQRLNWQDVKDLCKLLGQGYHCQAYYCKDLDIVLKKYKSPDIETIKNQINMLDKKYQIEPNLCKFILYDGPNLVGFSIKYFPGKSWDKLMSNKNSIFRRNPFAKIKLIFKLAVKVIEIQNLNICHADISLGNLIINVFDENDIKSQFNVELIDFSNAIDFSNNKVTHSCLTGWQFLLPPQSYKKPYNPKGVNVYQFGCICIHILEGLKFSQYKHQPKNIHQKLKQFKRKYSQEIYHTISQLVSHQVQNRLKIFFQKFSYNKLKNLQSQFNMQILKQINQQQKQTLIKAEQKTQANKIQNQQFDIKIASNWKDKIEKTFTQQDNRLKDFIGNVFANLRTQIPVIGIFIGALVTFLITSQSDNIDMICNIVDQKIQKAAARYIHDKLKGIRQILLDFFRVYRGYQKDKCNKYIGLGYKWQNVQTIFSKDRAHFMNKQYSMPIFPDFVMFANSHLLFLKLGINNKKLWGLNGDIQKSYQKCFDQYFQHGKRVIDEIQKAWVSKIQNNPRKRYNNGFGHQSYDKQYRQKFKNYYKNLQSIENQKQFFYQCVQIVYKWKTAQKNIGKEVHKRIEFKSKQKMQSINNQLSVVQSFDKIQCLLM